MMRLGVRDGEREDMSALRLWLGEGVWGHTKAGTEESGWEGRAGASHGKGMT